MAVAATADMVRRRLGLGLVVLGRWLLVAGRWLPVLGAVVVYILVLSFDRHGDGGDLIHRSGFRGRCRGCDGERNKAEESNSAEIEQHIVE